MSNDSTIFTTYPANPGAPVPPPFKGINESSQEAEPQAIPTPQADRKSVV